MNMAERILKVLNSLVDFAVILVLLLAGTYSVYALWDNNRIYSAAESVQANVLHIKPYPEADPAAGDSFGELRKINPDVCAWITLDHTKIDYPVLQGNDNFSYINTDVYGNYALAGSIFLDSRNDCTFQNAYSLLYGHHMENSKMFGDLDLYKEEEFFFDNSSGMLILPECTYRLEIFACLLVAASEKMIFEPQRWQMDAVESNAELFDFVANHSIHIRSDVMDRILASGAFPQILAMSTCSTEFTDARTVVLAIMRPYLPEI